MGGNSSTTRAKMAAMVDDRRARVASYKVRGHSIREICKLLADVGCVNPRTKKAWSVKAIDEDLQFLMERWRTEALKDVDEHVANELARLDEIEREAWAAWKRGIGRKEQTFTERKIGEEAKGKKADTRGKVSVRTEDLNGDPRYLTALLDCQIRRAKMLGLDKPDKHQHEGSIEVTDARERLMAAIAKRLEPSGSDGAATKPVE